MEDEAVVTYEVQLSVFAGDDTAPAAVVTHVAASVAEARAWVLTHARITKVVRRAVS